MQIVETEVTLSIRTPDGTTRPLHVTVSGAGAARAVAGGLDVVFRLSPPPTAGENLWVLLARIASEGARTDRRRS